MIELAALSLAELERELARLENAPIERFVNALLLSARAKKASHVRAIAVSSQNERGSVQFFIDGSWEEQIATPRQLHVPIVRRIGVMIGHLPPKAGQPRFGRVCLQLAAHTYQFLLVGIERNPELSAIIELVDEATYEAGRQPRPPSPHPYRAL